MNTFRLAAILTALLTPLVPGMVLSQSAIQAPAPGSTPAFPTGVTTTTPGTVNGTGTTTGGATTGGTITAPIPVSSPTTIPNGVQISPTGNVQTSGGQPSATGSAVPNQAVSPTAPNVVQISPNGTVQLSPNNIQLSPNGNVRTGVDRSFPGTVGPAGGTVIDTTNGTGVNTNAPGAGGATPVVPVVIPGGAQSATQSPTVIVIQSSPNGAIPSSSVSPAETNSPSLNPAPVGGTTGTLDAQLLQATCNQNWQQAIQVVNRALAAAPANQTAYRAQLTSYRNRLQSLQASQVRVPNWSQQCSGNFTATFLR